MPEAEQKRDPDSSCNSVLLFSFQCNPMQPNTQETFSGQATPGSELETEPSDFRVGREGETQEHHPLDPMKKKLVV